jgi:uncharacterized protein (TIGR01777 family)
MRVLITGASGLVGTALAEALAAQGHTVGRFVRIGAGATRPGDVAWNPAGDEFDAAAAEGADAVVNLAGASIAGGRWTAKRKAELRSSRIDLTQRLVGHLSRLQRKPAVLVSASATGYYGERGDETLTEASAPGSNFLAGICRDWEAAAMKAEEAGMRVAILRIGVVLAKAGGALPKMTPPIKMGVGGKLGSGKQWMSWVALEDVVSAIRFAIATETLRGAANLVAPNPARNAEFTKVLARVLRRPAIFPVPAFALRLMLGGEMADELLLGSERVLPQRLLEAKFVFRFAELEPALRHALQ